MFLILFSGILLDKEHAVLLLCKKLFDFNFPSILLILQHMLIKMLPYKNNTQYLLASYNVPDTELNTL